MANIFGITRFQVGDTVAVMTSQKLQPHWHEIREIKISIDNSGKIRISYIVRDIRMPGTTYEMPEDALYSPEDIKDLAQAVENVITSLEPTVQWFLRWALEDVDRVRKTIKSLTT
jgi:hypothetical protein